MLIKQAENQSAADFCRKYGIERGTRLLRTGDGGGDVYTICITAVGNTHVLAEFVEDLERPSSLGEYLFSFKDSSWILLEGE